MSDTVGKCLLCDELGKLMQFYGRQLPKHRVYLCYGHSINFFLNGEKWFLELYKDNINNLKDRTSQDMIHDIRKVMRKSYTE